MTNKKIGIIGSGIVAQTLATGLLNNGYEVMLGSRDTNKLSDWRVKNPKAKLGSFQQTAEFGETIILTVKATAAVEVAKSVANLLVGKTVIDTNNPFADAAPTNGVMKYFTSLDESLMERLQVVAPKANLVKAFNIVGAHLMVNPKLPDGIPTMLICGNNVNAKKEVTEILSQFGWDVEDMGAIEASRAIEPLSMLWAIRGMLHNQWAHAFKLLKA
jgi:8-hydroxy-5-deazaflavin:NADPH oxidoreductase